MELPLASYGIAVVGGALIGLLLAVFGGGGSVLATPLLAYLGAVGVVFVGLRVIMPVLCGEWVKPGIVTGLRVGRLAFGVTLLPNGA